MDKATLNGQTALRAAKRRGRGSVVGSIFTTGPTMTTLHAGSASASWAMSSRSIRSSMTPK